MTETLTHNDNVQGLLGNEEVRRAEKAFVFAPFSSLRAELSLSERENYELAHAEELRSSVSHRVFGEIKSLLHGEKIDVVTPVKVSDEFGFLSEALSVGYIKGRDQLIGRDIGLIGVCLPDEINLQTIMPMVIAKHLLDRGNLKKVYMALPVGAYAIAGFPRIEQYKQVLRIAADIFGEERLGVQVVIMPDYRLHLERGAIGSMASPRISDAMAKHKYPFSNLFSYTEVAGYGADIALPALVEKKPVLVIADFMQYESIHAGRFATHEVGQDMSALLLPMLSPHVQNGKMVAISHMSEAFESDQCSCLEVNPVMLAGSLVMDEDETKQAYTEGMRTGKIAKEILSRVKKLQENVRFCRPLPDERVRAIEDESMNIFSEVAGTIHEELQKRMMLAPHVARYVKGGFI